MLAIALRALWFTFWGRLRRGPARPTWSWRFELTARLLQLWSAVVEALDVRARRRAQERMVRPLPRTLAAAVEIQTVALGHLEVERLTPRSGAGDGAVLYLHGGSFIGGSSRTYRDLLARLCLASRTTVHAPNYRLAPDYRYPAALDDATAVYQRLLASGVDPHRLALVGDSAGGNLVLALLQRLRDQRAPLPAAAVLLSPWVDLEARGGSLDANAAFDWASPEDFVRWAEIYAPRHDLRQPLVSPIHAELRGLPPLRVEVGTAEMLLDQVRALVERARGQGAAVELVEHVDMVHDCYLFAGQFPACERALREVGVWIGQRLGGASD